MFFPIALGWFIHFRGHIGEKEISFLNRLCFKYLLAFHLFNSTVAIDFSAEFSPRLIIFCSLGIFMIMILSWLFFGLTVRDREKRCILIVSSFRSNNIIYALPIAANLFGDAGTKVAAMLMPMTIILFNFFCVIVMVYHAPGEAADGTETKAPDQSGGLGATLKRTVIDIFRNPLIIGSILGIVVSLSGIPIPRFVRSGINMVAITGTPLALLLLGSQIDFKQLAGNLAPAFGACLLRLVIVPAILVPLFAFIGFRGPELGALMVVFSAPCAVNNLIMARNYNINPGFAAQTVYLSTVLSLLTMFCYISLLRGLGFF
jgi:predicted permease